MRIARGRIVNGAVVTEAHLPEGAQVAILLEEEGEFDLEPDDESAIEAAVASLDSGDARPISRLERRLRTTR